MAQHDQKFFICKHCGNLVGMIHNAGVPIICCGEPMHELKANSTEAAGEKHLPVVKVEGKKISVEVGSTHHPMSEEHSIQWIYLETKHGGQRKGLSSDAAPKAEFAVADDAPVSVYAYCNLHGLWRTMIEE